VADVPHQTVIGGVEDVMQGDGQLDHAEAGTEVPAALANAVEQVLAQFVSEGFQVRFGQAAQFVGRVGAVEQRRQRALAGDLVESGRHQANRYRCKRCGSLPDAGKTAQSAVHIAVTGSFV